MKYTQKMVLLPEDKYNRLTSTRSASNPSQFSNAATQTSTPERDVKKEMKVEVAPPPPPGLPVKKTIRKRTKTKWIKFVHNSNGDV